MAPRLNPRAVRVELVVDQWLWDKICSERFGFPLSVSFPECLKLIHSFIHMTRALRSFAFNSVISNTHDQEIRKVADNIFARYV